MTTSAQIETAWTAAIWSHATITALTDKIYKFQVTEDSEFEVAKLYYNEQVNFFEVLTGRTQRYLQTANQIGRIAEYDFIVEINYYKEIDTTGAAFTAVRDALESIFALAVTELGDTWSNTVDIWRPDPAFPTIVSTSISTKKVWKGTYRFFAEKQSEIS
jgi:hypothetical protein